MRKYNCPIGNVIVLAIALVFIAFLFSGCGSKEEKASSLYQKAVQQYEAGNNRAVIKLTRTVISKFPGTEVAESARELHQKAKISAELKHKETVRILRGWIMRILATIVGIVGIVCFIACAPGFVYLLVAYFKRLRSSEKGFKANPDLELLKGKTGTVKKTLRPAGVVSIKGKNVDVVTEGEFLAQGVQVKVIEVRGNKVVVKEIENTSRIKEKRNCQI